MSINIYGQSSTIDTTYTEASVISKDGTKIGYRKYGHGPALILVQGAMGTVFNYHQLAKALSNNFTVYVPERRGRGLSPKEFTPDHVIERDVEDVNSIITASGASYLFGLSSGAIITLEATKVLPSIKMAAIYEPPLYVTDAVPVKKINTVFKEISNGNLSAALANVFKIVKVGPRIFNYIPLPILKQLTRVFIKSEDKKKNGQYAKVRDLIPAMRFDFTAVLQRGGKVQTYNAIDKPVLLLGGSNSPKYLRDALDTLEKTLLHVSRIKFKSLDHNGPWNTDRGGSPELIAKALINYFKKNELTGKN
ncbi:MAG: alpha/beta hydrolase [Bacteroidota bacterium]|nr:alpha/beta hydrolase [Bacteroidota bacterium]